MHRTLTVSFALAAALPAQADFTLTRSVIATGGTSAGGLFTVTGTTGETAAGSAAASGARFDLASGFWAGRPAVMWPVLEPQAPTVQTVGGGPGFHVGLEWSPSRAGWRLEISYNLIHWSTALASTTTEVRNSVTLVGAGPVPRLFFWRQVRLP